MNDDRGGFHPFQVPDEVEIAQAFPHGLLHPSDHSEGGEIPGFAWIPKITSDTKLEGALPVGLWVPLSQAGRRQLVA